jgi:Fe-S cluster assembly ATP-binding protein
MTETATSATHELRIEDLHASVSGKDILNGIDLVVNSGEVHAVMGPNGSGKSTLAHVIMGKPGYRVTAGRVLLDGVDVLSMSIWARAQAGLFLAMQYPIEVPGVSLDNMLEQSVLASGGDPATVRDVVVAEAVRIGFDDQLVVRPLNVDLSGGEKKRNETLQLAVLRPRFAVLDELDSGLDIDALRACARRIEEATHETGLGVLAITHYSRLLTVLKPDVVHVLARGRIQLTGGPELADELESTGYAGYAEDEAQADAKVSARLPGFTDPTADLP